MAIQKEADQMAHEQEAMREVARQGEDRQEMHLGEACWAVN